MKHLLTIVAVTVFCGSLSAQSIAGKNITWEATSVMDVNNGDLKEALQKVISHENTHVDWFAGGVTKTYNVKEVLGQWTNITSNGEIVYEIGNEQERGTMTFTRNENGVSIRIVIINNTDATPVNVELKISNTSVE